MRAVKAVKVSYQPSEDIIKLLQYFRDAVNYCIHVGLEKNITSRFRLQNEVYHKLTEHGYHSWYVLGAVEVATAILKNYRKAKRRNRKTKVPRARKLMAKLGNQAYKIVEDQLRIPIKPKQYFYVSLHKRAKQFLSDSTLKLGSVTLTARMMVLTFVKTAEVAEPRGFVAIDVNEDNITAVSSDGEVRVFDLSKLRKSDYGYFERKRVLQQKYHRDRRLLRKSLERLSRNHTNKVSTMLHQVSKAIVEWCKAEGLSLIHEDLKGLRKTVNRKAKRFNKFNGKVQIISKRPKRLKRRLNNWWFRKFLSQISYKSAWEGIKAIESKHTRGSSSTCPICGCRLNKYPNGLVECKKCGVKESRHIIACMNLLKWEPAVQAQPLLECSREPSPNKPIAMRKS